MVNKKAFFAIIITLDTVFVLCFVLSFVVSSPADSSFSSAAAMIFATIWTACEIQYADKPNKWGINTLKARHIKRGTPNVYRRSIIPLFILFAAASLFSLIKALVSL